MRDEFFCFTFMAMSHADDAPCDTAGRPCENDKSGIKPTSRDETRLAVIPAVIHASEMRPSKDFVGAQHVHATLVQNPFALGWVARDSHHINVATINNPVKQGPSHLAAHLVSQASGSQQLDVSILCCRRMSTRRARRAAECRWCWRRAHDRGGRPTRCFTATEQPVLASRHNRPDRVLDRVVVDRTTASSSTRASRTQVAQISRTTTVANAPDSSEKSRTSAWSSQHAWRSTGTSRNARRCWSSPLRARPSARLA